jgi:hypothetical protein
MGNKVLVVLGNTLLVPSLRTFWGELSHRLGLTADSHGFLQQDARVCKPANSPCFLRCRQLYVDLYNTLAPRWDESRKVMILFGALR